MAEDPKQLAEAQRLANEAMKESNDLSRAFGTLLDANLKKQKKVNAAIQNAADIIEEQIADRKDDISLQGRLGNISARILSTEQKKNLVLKNYFGKNQQLGKDIAKDLDVQIKGLKVEEGRLKLANDIAEKAEEQLEKYKMIGRVVSGITFAGILAFAQKFTNQLDSIGKQFGSLNVLGDTFNQNLLEAGSEAIAVGGSLEDVTAITSDLASNFGISLDQATELSNKVLDTAKATGLSNDEATQLFGTLKATANISADQAERLAEGAFQLARQAGVAPQQVLKDIAGSSETIATFTKDSGENLFEAAVAARQFGLNIDSVAKAARSTLDFQSSLESELQASVLLGTQLNLQKARQLALDKDLVGFQAEIKNQLSDIGDFTELDVFQQESLAKALGMSVGEVAKLASGTQQLSVSGALAAGNFEDIAGQEALSNLGSIVAQVKSLAATFLVEVGPSIENAVEGIQNFISNDENLEMIKERILGIANVAKFVVSNFSLIAGAIVGLKSTFFVLDILKKKSVALALASAARAAGLSASAAGPAAAILLPVLLGGLTAAVLSSISKVDDVAIPSGGANVITGPAGTFQLNPNDQVVAGTNLGGGGGSQVDINPLVEATNRTTEAISKLQITAGRGEIRVAMEPALGGSL